MVNLPQPSDYEIEQKFMDFLRSNNLEPVGSFRFIMDGTIQRYRLPDDKRGQTSGAYCVYTDKWPIGWAMDWHTRNKIDWYCPAEGLNEEQQKYFHSAEFKAVKPQRSNVKKQSSRNKFKLLTKPAFVSIPVQTHLKITRTCRRNVFIHTE